jgi:hypothetical protein
MVRRRPNDRECPGWTLVTAFTASAWLKLCHRQDRQAARASDGYADQARISTQLVQRLSRSTFVTSESRSRSCCSLSGRSSRGGCCIDMRSSRWCIGHDRAAHDARPRGTNVCRPVVPRGWRSASWHRSGCRSARSRSCDGRSVSLTQGESKRWKWDRRRLTPVVSDCPP